MYFTRIVRCQRHKVRELDGSERTLHFKLDLGRLGHFRTEKEMPPFEGDEGFVEVLGPLTQIMVLRQVEAGTSTRQATEAEYREIYRRTRRKR